MANLLFNYNFIFNYNCNAAARYGLACGSSLSPGCAGGGGIAAARCACRASTLAVPPTLPFLSITGDTGGERVRRLLGGALSLPV